jgi:transcriptional regulator with XRE-family HTH domain
VPIKRKSLKPGLIQKPPETLGEHILARRRSLKLKQRELAKQLKVREETIINWEKGRTTELPYKLWPSILEFLGYNPLPEPQSVPEKLQKLRRKMGWTIKQAATHSGMDEGTWSRFEEGRRPWSHELRELLRRLIG